MNITLQKVKIRDLFNGYEDNQDEGVCAYGGKLNIRPKYQREFTYESDKQIAVINTVLSDFPLSVMYWVKNSDGSFELLDGQQRTLSICRFLSGDFSVAYSNYPHYFSTFKANYPNLAEKILDYELMCYFVEDSDDEKKLQWFRTINIAGKILNDQELLNANYTGPWLTDAKSKFSKPTNCPAELEASQYLVGKPIEQDYLATALKWISSRDNMTVEQYMAKHQHDKNCNELWFYFKNVIDWAKTIFSIYRKDMKGLDWGMLYNAHHNEKFDASTNEDLFNAIHSDADINASLKDIYKYIITKNENLLNRRLFDDKTKRQQFEKQRVDKKSEYAVCPSCEKQFKFEEMEADHIHPWSKGGKSTIENCKMLCKPCNASKSNKY